MIRGIRPELVVELAGGLGNQMFQYAFALKLQSLGHRCLFYYDESQRKHDGPLLEEAFGISMPWADPKQVLRLQDVTKDPWSKLQRKVTRRTPSVYWEHDKGYAYKTAILKLEKPMYLQGCWLSEKYFQDIAPVIRASFQFTGKPAHAMTEIKNRENAVSVHIRRGDYLNSVMHRHLAYPDYLRHAVSLIEKHLASRNNNSQCELYVFTDDAPAAHAQMGALNNTHRVHYPGDANNSPYRDMQLMAACSHHIIANSTFSWWGAWLNRNPDKIVISPKDWFTNDFLNDNDIVPEEWITI